MEAPKDHVLALERRLKSERIDLGEVLREAKVDRSTWTRWKQGKHAPSMDRWMRIKAAADRRAVLA